MTGPGLVLTQLNYDQRIFWRNPMSVFFTVIQPLIFLAIFVEKRDRDLAVEHPQRARTGIERRGVERQSGDAEVDDLALGEAPPRGGATEFTTHFGIGRFVCDAALRHDRARDRPGGVERPIAVEEQHSEPPGPADRHDACRTEAWCAQLAERLVGHRAHGQVSDDSTQQRREVFRTPSGAVARHCVSIDPVVAICSWW